MTEDEAARIAEARGYVGRLYALADPDGFYCVDERIGGGSIFIYAESGEWSTFSRNEFRLVLRSLYPGEREQRLSEELEPHVFSEVLRRMLRMSALELARLRFPPTRVERLLRRVTRLFGVRQASKS